MNRFGPIPNVVIFQFNPESLSRSLQIPQRPTGATQRETTQAGEKTFEKITLKAHFTAADMLAEDKVLAKLFGIGPQLAALEKMVLPSSKIAGLIGAAIDAIGDALGGFLVAFALQVGEQLVQSALRARRSSCRRGSLGIGRDRWSRAGDGEKEKTGKNAPHVWETIP